MLLIHHFLHGWSLQYTVTLNGGHLHRQASGSGHQRSYERGCLSDWIFGLSTTINALIFSVQTKHNSSLEIIAETEDIAQQVDINQNPVLCSTGKNITVKHFSLFSIPLFCLADHC